MFGYRDLENLGLRVEIEEREKRIRWWRKVYDFFFERERERERETDRQIDRQIQLND